MKNELLTAKCSTWSRRKIDNSFGDHHNAVIPYDMSSLFVFLFEGVFLQVPVCQKIVRKFIEGTFKCTASADPEA